MEWNKLQDCLPDDGDTVIIASINEIYKIPAPPREKIKFTYLYNTAIYYLEPNINFAEDEWEGPGFYTVDQGLLLKYDDDYIVRWAKIGEILMDKEEKRMWYKRILLDEE